jgi:hypothetical protein
MSRILVSRILGLLFSLVIFLVGCSPDNNININNINGRWRIFIGNEYSQKAKILEILLTDTSIFYDKIELDSLKIEYENIKAEKHFKKDSIFKLDIRLTFEKNKLWGNEIWIINEKADTTYIFGEKIK